MDGDERRTKKRRRSSILKENNTRENYKKRVSWAPDKTLHFDKDAALICDIAGSSQILQQDRLSNETKEHQSAAIGENNQEKLDQTVHGEVFMDTTMYNSPTLDERPPPRRSLVMTETSMMDLTYFCQENDNDLDKSKDTIKGGSLDWQQKTQAMGTHSPPILSEQECSFDEDTDSNGFSFMEPESRSSEMVSPVESSVRTKETVKNDLQKLATISEPEPSIQPSSSGLSSMEPKSCSLEISSVKSSVGTKETVNDDLQKLATISKPEPSFQPNSSGISSMEPKSCSSEMVSSVEDSVRPKEAVNNDLQKLATISEPEASFQPNSSGLSSMEPESRSSEMVLSVESSVKVTKETVNNDLQKLATISEPEPSFQPNSSAKDLNDEVSILKFDESSANFSLVSHTGDTTTIKPLLNTSKKIDVEEFLRTVPPFSKLFDRKSDSTVVDDKCEEVGEGESLKSRISAAVRRYLQEETQRTRNEIEEKIKEIKSDVPEVILKYYGDSQHEANAELQRITSELKEYEKSRDGELDKRLEAIRDGVVSEFEEHAVNATVMEVEESLKRDFDSSLQDELSKLEDLNSSLKEENDKKRKEILEGLKTDVLPSVEEVEKLKQLMMDYNERKREFREGIEARNEEWKVLRKFYESITSHVQARERKRKVEEKNYQRLKSNREMRKYWLYDTLEESALRRVCSYLHNSLTLTRQFDHKGFVEQYQLDSDFGDKCFVPPFELNLYKLVHDVIKHKSRDRIPAVGSPVSAQMKLLADSTVEVMVSRSTQLVSSIVEFCYSHLEAMLDWDSKKDVVAVTFKTQKFPKRLVMEFAFVERSFNGHVQKADFLPIEYKIIKNTTTNVSEKEVKAIMDEASSLRDQPDGSLFCKSVLTPLAALCLKF